MLDPYLLGYDFYYLWSAGRIAGSGGNPYDYATFQAQLQQIGWPNTQAVQGITHLPWIFWIYILLGYLPFTSALILWEVLLAGGFALLLVYLRNSALSILMGFRELAPNRFFFAALTFPAMWGNLAFGQVNIIAFAGLLLAINSALSQSALMCGFALALTIAKPHLLLPLFAALGTYFVKKRQFGFLIGLIFGVAAQIAITYALAPSLFHFYYQHAASILSDVSLIAGASIGQVSAKYLQLWWIRPVLVTIGVVIGVGWGIRKQKIDDSLVLVILPLALVTTPYVWSHSFILLYPTYLAAIAFLYSTIGDNAKILIAAFSILGLSLIYRTDLEPLWCLFSLALLLFGIARRSPSYA